MADTVFSNHYTSTTSGESVEVGFKPGVGSNSGVVSSGTAITNVGAGVNHSRVRTSLATATIPVTVGSPAAAWATGDFVRLLTMRSSDRIVDIRIWTDATLAAATALATDIGIYLAGLNHDGAVVDVDLFGTAFNLMSASPVARVSVFDDGALADEHRYLPLWAALSIGAGTDTSDPEVLYDIALTMGTVTGAVVAGEVFLEVEYIAGD